MSAHLPECQYGLDYPCICSRLRACEARVTERHNAEHEDDRLAVFSKGYRSGVQVARDAVADCRVPWPTATGVLVNEGIDDALAAIDALRGDK